MKRSLTLLIVVATITTGAVSVQAALIDRGGGLIYDTDLNITWLQDANYAMTSGYDADGQMTWAAAMTWAANLTYYDSVRGVWYDDWRLPTALNQDGSGPCTGYNCTGSEMGHLYHTELGNPAGGPLASTGPFIHLQPWVYWSGTDPLPGNAWASVFNSGWQDAYAKANDDAYAWPVRPGDVSAVPEPGTLLLLGGGLAGLLVASRRRRN